MRRGEIFQHFELYVPRAYHHARFMGKSIMLQKIFLLLDAFPLTPQELQKVKRLVCFVVTLYGRYFLSAPLSLAAPRRELTMWYDLQSYRQHDQQIAQAALTSMRRHLWYLCPELVILALFDELTSYDEKQILATMLLNTPRPNVFATGKPGQPAFNSVARLLTNDKPSLGAFVTERSWLLFSLLGSQTNWLQDDPAVWPDSVEYENCQRFCKELEVVNDPAERAVKAVQETANMTRDPAHRDAVVVVMCDHRGRVANLRKTNLNAV